MLRCTTSMVPPICSPSQDPAAKEIDGRAPWRWVRHLPSVPTPTLAVVDLVVAASPAGLDVAGRGEVPRAELADWAADAEHARPRWVWADTATVYPVLLAAGVRVARCHDLRLTEAILRPAGLAGPPPGWLGHARTLEPADAPSMLDGLGGAGDGPTAPQVADLLADQASRLTAAREPGRLRLLLAAESAGALAAAEMHADGLPWSREVHDELLTAALGARPAPGFRPARLEELAGRIRTHLAAPLLNPDSPVELLRALRGNGLDVTSTARWDLSRSDHPVVGPLLEYKRLARLLSANGWAWLDSWVEPAAVEGRADRFRTDYVPGGVVTGRWATSGGGALQIPKTIRGAVVADPGWVLVTADAAQIEPRALAAMAHDEELARAGRDGDLYRGLVDAGVVETRERAKVGMLGALYGGTAGESGVVMPRLRRAYPRATALVDEAARTGERGGVVQTWLGRTSPPPGEAWRDGQTQGAQVDASADAERRARTQARSWGRFTRNFVVQGTAAEWALCWMAELRRRLRELPAQPPLPGERHAPGQGRPHLVFFLHDEIVVHAPAPLADDVVAAVRTSAETAGTLLFGDFPITFPLDVAVVESYADAP